MNAWQILHIDGTVALPDPVIAETAKRAVIIAVDNGLDPVRGYVARRLTGEAP